MLLLVAFMWGSTFVASKFLLNDFSPIFLISVRFILASVLMSFIFRDEMSQIKRNDIKGGVIVGLTLFIAFYLQLFALKFTDPGKQAFLAGTYVVFVPFINWALHKIKPTMKSIISVMLCFVGISFLTLGSDLNINQGDLITVLSSVFFAAHIIATNYYTNRSTPKKISAIQFITVAILSTSIVLITSSYPPRFDLGHLLPILYLGLVCTGVAYSLQTFAQKHTSNTTTAIILSLESVFGSILSVLLYQEVFTSKMVLGSIIILISILVSEVTLKKTKELVYE